MDTIDTKTCKVCKESKSLYYYRPRAAVCNICYNKQHLIKYAHKRRTVEQLKTYTRNKELALLNMKFCKHCKKALFLTEFDKNRGICKACRNAINNSYTRNKLLVANNNKRTVFKRKELMSDTYIRHLIKGMVYKITGKQLKTEDIPQQFIELKRKQLTLKKQIEHGNKSNHEENNSESH